MREPYNMSLAQIAGLTDWQLVNLALRPGDKSAAEKGYYWPVGKWVEGSEDDPYRPIVAPFMTFHDLYRTCLKKDGVPEDEIERRFKAEHPNYKMN